MKRPTLAALQVLTPVSALPTATVTQLHAQTQRQAATLGRPTRIAAHLSVALTAAAAPTPTTGLTRHGQLGPAQARYPTFQFRYTGRLWALLPLALALVFAALAHHLTLLSLVLPSTASAGHILDVVMTLSQTYVQVVVVGFWLCVYLLARTRRLTFGFAAFCIWLVWYLSIRLCASCGLYPLPRRKRHRYPLRYIRPLRKARAQATLVHTLHTYRLVRALAACNPAPFTRPAFELTRPSTLVSRFRVTPLRVSSQRAHARLSGVQLQARWDSRHVTYAATAHLWLNLQQQLATWLQATPGALWAATRAQLIPPHARLAVTRAVRSWRVTAAPTVQAAIANPAVDVAQPWAVVRQPGSDLLWTLVQPLDPFEAPHAWLR